MADVKVEKGTQEQQQQQGRALERQGAEVARRGEWYPGDLFSMNPFGLMRRMSEEMDRAFGTSFGLWRGLGREMNFAPAIEVREQDNNLVISADLPGIDKNDIRVEYTPEGLVIEGERKHEAEEQRGGVHRSERSYGRFYRLIPLPEGTNPDKAKAQFKDGVLEIRMPLPETRKPKQIPINA